MTQPLGFLKAGSTTLYKTEKKKELAFSVVHSVAELDKILNANKSKRVLVDFSAEWCTSCKEFEEITFKDSAVIKKMQEFVLVRADVTKNGDDEKKLSQKYGVFGPPAILFFDENHQLQKSKTVIGFMEPEEFLQQLNK